MDNGGSFEIGITYGGPGGTGNGAGWGGASFWAEAGTGGASTPEGTVPGAFGESKKEEESIWDKITIQGTSENGGGFDSELAVESLVHLEVDGQSVGITESINDGGIAAVGKGIYEGLCVVSDKCTDGAINFYGNVPDEVRKQINDGLSSVTGNNSLYDTDLASSWMARLAKLDHPVIFALHEGETQVVPVPSGRGFFEEGSPSVVLVNMRQANNLWVHGTSGGVSHKVNMPLGEVMFHEVIHTVQVGEGTINMYRSSSKTYGTNKQWEIDAVRSMNKIRRTWQRDYYPMAIPPK